MATRSTGNIIKELRTKFAMTQIELADRLNLSQKAVSFYELDQRIPPPDILLKLSQIFNVTVDYLLGKPVLAKGLLPEELAMHSPVEHDCSVTMSGREFLRAICKDSPEAVEIIDRMIITDGEVNVTGIDLESKDYIQHQLKGLIMALKAAKIENGKAHVEFTPDLKGGSKNE